LPQAKAHALGKKGRASAAQKKRREDPNPERRGSAINVATRVREEELDEKWSQKYKSSINCAHPKGFSQKAHCAGKRKHNEDITMEHVCPDCGMCETHGDHTRNTLDEACWKGYHKEGMKTMFGKRYPNCVKNEDASDAADSGPNILDLLRSWRNRVPAQYAWHLTKTFGDPHDATHDLVVWHDQDGFKRIEIKDEYVMHISPSPHYDYCYSYIDLEVPHRLSSALANCSESILIDHLKNEVGARCASLAANAVTLNFVMDVVAGRARPSRDEYEQRIMNMHDEFENGKIFTIQWWPDQSHDTDPKNSYYAKKEIAEDKRIPRKSGQPANSKKHSDLYTDENPQGTITGLKFATVEDARASVSRIRSSGRSHAHKVQAAVAMEQRARAAGKASAAAVYRSYINSVKKTDESLEIYVDQGVCPVCHGNMVAEDQIAEKQDACYHKVKSRYKVWPSAYASGALVQCRKKGAANWGNKNESQENHMDELSRIVELSSNLTADQRAELDEEFDLIESIIDQLAERNGVDSELIWEDLDTLDDDELYVFAVTQDPIMEDWSKTNKRDKTDGMSRKAVKAYRREHPGSKLQTAVTTKPSKLKKGSKASKRRKSYCSRSKGQMNMHNISCAKTPDKAICKARRRWNC
jgi:hypothetical protein